MDKNKDAVLRAFKHIQNQKAMIQNHPLRQRYHFESPTGWCNDPNGVVYYNGRYHLFYQFMPYNSDPFNYSMYWGHASSADLCHWQDHPPALSPSDDYDMGGCWSGSGFIDKDTFKIMYTGIDTRQGDRRQVQCLAGTDDMIHFVKDPANPVLINPPRDTNKIDFRDPKVWEHDGIWYMVLGSASSDGFGKVLLYKSEDLRKWTFVNVLVESKGELGPIGECPDFFELDGKHVLLLSPKQAKKRKVIYLIGDFSYEVGKFHWNAMGEVDWGMDYYATQTLLDDKNRRIAIAWQNSWDWMPWCDGEYFTSKLGWCGGMAIPRELSLNEENILVTKPVAEFAVLRGGMVEIPGREIEDGEQFAFSVGDNVHCEWIAEFDLNKTNAAAIEFNLRSNGALKAAIVFDLSQGEIHFDRTNTLYHIPYLRSCPLRSAGGDKLTVHVFMDSTSIEFFTDGYTTSMSNTIYLPSDAVMMNINAKGGRCKLKSLKGWEMGSRF